MQYAYSTGRHHMNKLSLPIVLCFIALFVSFAMAESTADDEHAVPQSFLPTWKLLNPQEKQLFISGYLHGWKDAARVTELVQQHVTEHPEQTLKSLRTIRSIYDLGGKNTRSLGPLVKGIDEFYANPDNARAALSRAITASTKYE